MQSLQTLFPHDDFVLLAVIVALPLLGAIVNGVFGKRLGKDAVRLMALASVGASFLFSLLAFLLLLARQSGETPARLHWLGWEWFRLSASGEASFINSGGDPAGIPLEIALSLDALNGVMALIVTGVGFLIHLYSTSYMREDAGFHRFFAYLNLFIFAMLVLILGDSLPVLFIGWEGVGLCSYLLIGFWFEEEANASAGKKAFIVNRIGDFGLLVSMALLAKYTGALDWGGIEAGSAGLDTLVRVWHLPFLPGSFGEPIHVSAATLVGLTAFLGCAGKSAQLPLYVWLPDAMAGPTPVSALIHAATMVTAGVYLVCRMSFVFVMSPAAMMVVAVVGALTAVFAATIAFVQTDIKKVLAYSTVSQLGYMFLGVGVGAFTAGFFHVVTHAFFKACLFLGAGSVIHALHARIHDTDSSQDMRNMGGLRKYLPQTHLTFLISCLAIAGLPLTSGFFSKDEIIYRAYTSQVVTESTAFVAWAPFVNKLVFVLAVLGAIMTAFYMFRLYFGIFAGDFRGWQIVKGWRDPHAGDAHGQAAHHHGSAGHGEPLTGPTPHESPWAMTLPLGVLAFLALFGGLLNAHLLHITPLDQLLQPVFDNHLTVRQNVVSTDPEHQLALPLLIPGVAAFLIGVGFAYFVYIVRRGQPAASLAQRVPGFYRLLRDKWRVDELYDELVVGTLDSLAELSVRVDKYVVDGILAKLSSWLVALFGHVLRQFQTGQTHAYAAFVVLGTVGLGWFFVRPHSEIIANGPRVANQYQCLEGACQAQAAAGLGYAYRWDVNGDGELDTPEFGSTSQIDFKLEPGETRTIQLEVRNAFGSTLRESFAFVHPMPDGSLPAVTFMGAPHAPASADTMRLGFAAATTERSAER